MMMALSSGYLKCIKPLDTYYSYTYTYNILMSQKNLTAHFLDGTFPHYSCFWVFVVNCKNTVVFTSSR